MREIPQVPSVPTCAGTDGHVSQRKHGGVQTHELYTVCSGSLHLLRLGQVLSIKKN